MVNLYAPFTYVIRAYNISLPHIVCSFKILPHVYQVLRKIRWILMKCAPFNILAFVMGPKNMRNNSVNGFIYVVIDVTLNDCIHVTSSKVLYGICRFQFFMSEIINTLY